MKRAHILVEGQTEETFVRKLLQPHLGAYHLHLEPKLAETKRIRGGGSYKGGIVSYGKVRFDIQRLLGDTSAVIVTTMIDFYGLAGKGFPGWATMTGSCYEKVRHVETALRQDIDHPRFLPYLALHEYEALLFCQTSAIVSETGTDNLAAQRKLEAVRSHYGSPEEINLEMPPSKRIEAVIPEYTKVVAGVLIALEIGLMPMRQQCPHFDAWLQTLEQIAQS